MGLDLEKSVVVIIDIQEKLVKAANCGEFVSNNIQKIAKTAKILNIPVIVTEQYPRGLGSTVESLKNVLPEHTCFVEKTSFSAYSEDDFKNFILTLKQQGKTQVIIGGIETHICVLQTVTDLLEKENFEVYVLSDCCSSRKEFEHNQGIELMVQRGAKTTCTEIVLFEWLKTSKNPHFKEIQALIK